MVEVFKTNVEETAQGVKIVDLLLEHFPNNKINFDLHNCDKMLRVEGTSFCVETIITFVVKNY
jgi:hypothetical protein